MNGLVGTGQFYRQMGNDMLAGAADRERQREETNKQIKQQGQMSDLSAIGTGIGLGAQIGGPVGAGIGGLIGVGVSLLDGKLF